jgi:LmbE family N-acetylglucosaminyl deacetylase
MPTALALSPHLDDAAFSCGGTLARLAGEGWRVVIATAFTRSVPNPQGFALACQLDKGLGPEIDYMALRRAEDAAAAAVLGAEPLWLDFPEAPHRGYGSARALFQEPRAEDGIAAELKPALDDLLAKARPDLVLAPQALGGHVDHVQLVRALLELDIRPPVLWWRDTPYDRRNGAPPEPFAERWRDLSEAVLPLSDRDRAAKLQASAAYASQIGFQYGGLDGLRRSFADEEAAERFRLQGAAAIPGAQAA